ncbi:hypothetical protein WICPIJ_002250 [Wickerhamomyces pijperi]|uniref:Uncharacterized protein n=1 Tax=Wickerhamomyces pijperi TaxID=599730 RepID=A0A9P8QA64_WICPI|nr:hypothetical protein WICPIJ_002250 [Wickerhamomyces pijperi]
MSLLSTLKLSSKSSDKPTEETVAEVPVTESTPEMKPEAQEVAPVEETTEPAAQNTEAANTEAANIATEATEVEATATNCQTSAHLMQYPVIKSTVDLIEEIPGVKTAVDSTQHVAELIHGQFLLKPVIETIDTTGNAALNTVDSIAPCLQTTDYETIGKAVQEPFVQANAAIKGATEYVHDTVDSVIVAPSVGFTHSAREYINKNIYDTQGKPIVRSAIDPLVRPYNNVIESITEKFFPEGEAVSKDFKTEWDRKFPLEINLVKKVIPATADAATNVALAPYRYGSHVVDVVQQNLKKDQNKSVVSSLQALYQSKTDLTSEAWDHTVGAGYNHVFGKKAEEAQEETEEPVVEAAEAPVVEAAEAPAATEEQA